MNKKITQALIVLGIILLSASSAISCPVCEKQQPDLLKGISHGAGPQNNWDLVIVSVTAVIVLLTLFYSLKWLINPGEKSPTHIKYVILTEDYNENKK